MNLISNFVTLISLPSTSTSNVSFGQDITSLKRNPFDHVSNRSDNNNISNFKYTFTLCIDTRYIISVTIVQIHATMFFGRKQKNLKKMTITVAKCCRYKTTFKRSMFRGNCFIFVWHSILHMNIQTSVKRIIFFKSHLNENTLFIITKTSRV